MSIPEGTVAAVVAEVSTRMGNPDYGQLAIGAFVQSQPHLSRYVTAQADELGGGEAVMHAVFHAEVMAECFRRHLGRELGEVSFEDLHKTALKGPDRISQLTEAEPALAGYLTANVEDQAVQGIVALLALAMGTTPPPAKGPRHD